MRQFMDPIATKRFEGIVTSIKTATNPTDNLYAVLSNAVAEIRSNLVLELYDIISFESSEKETKEVEVKRRGKRSDYERMLKRLVNAAGIGKNAEGIELKGKPYGNVIKNALPKMQDAAKELVARIISGTPVVVRFHNDGDGSGGATALYRAVSDLQQRLSLEPRNVLWHINRSIAYTVESAFEDSMLFSAYSSAEKPVLLITDFGTSPESEAAIKHISGKCDIIWIDHHLPYENFPRGHVANYINAWDFGGDSNTTAGLLTCMLAQLVSDVDVELLMQASLMSDYSEYADLGNKNAHKLALILDFMTSGKSRYDGQGTTPKQIEAIIDDKQKFDEVFGFASKLLDEALAVGLENIRSYRSGPINVHVLDFGHVAKLGYDYPLPGRYSSKLQERMELLNLGSTITMVHYGNYISIRLSRDISDKVQLLSIIKKLKESGEISSGGGHKEAASVRIEGENLDRAMKVLLKELGVKGA